MPAEALAFSTEMDGMFAEFADRIGNGYRRRLIVERRLDDVTTQHVRLAAAWYLAASLGVQLGDLNEAELLQTLRERKSEIPNITPNGVLMPKREHVAEYNLLHKAVARAVKQFLPDEFVDTIQTYINYRIVDGIANAAVDQRAYATSKMHSDVWAGDPLDSVTVMIPILGDPTNITVKFFEMPREDEHGWMRQLDDYSLAAGIQPLTPYDDLDFRVGSIFFFDSRLLHQTARMAPGFRISLDFRFRRKTQWEGKPWFVDKAVGNRDQNPYVSYDDWSAVGTDAMLVVNESGEEARRRFAQGGAAAKGSAVPQFAWLRSDKSA